MKKYSVTLYFHTNIEVEVTAENEQDAIEQAYNRLDNDNNKELVEILLDGLEEDDNPEVIELK